MSSITAYCNISAHSCKVNGKLVFKNEEDSNESFLKKIYKNLQVDYPKFYKMDMLSKLAFLGTEMLIQSNENIAGYKDDEIAMLFSNKHSSAEADIRFRLSYTEQGVPSPALFVYTLPNILIGEIAIRNKWFGENLFTVYPSFDSGFFANYPEILLSKSSGACLCGWLNVIDDMEAFLFFVEKKDIQKLNLPLTPEILNQLYKS